MIELQQVDVCGKRVLIRADLNVAVNQGAISSDYRIRASLDSIKYVREADGAALVVSHFGRPKAGVFAEQYSLRPVAQHIEQLLGCKVKFIDDWLNRSSLLPGEIGVGENVRFLKGETSCSKRLSQQMAGTCDVFVLDAFGAAHRNHSSISGIVHYVDTACVGMLCKSELRSLHTALDQPKTPILSIVGGAKIEGKLQALRRLAELSDTLIVGGGIANTLLAANGVSMGRSLHQPELLGVAKEILEYAKKHNCRIPLPVDFIVARSLSDTENARVTNPKAVSKEDMILDVGPRSQKLYCRLIKNSKTVVWNGPVGVFEIKPFHAGTRKIANCIANSGAFSAAGGGDTLAALEQFGLFDRITYTSTGGGAFLEYIQGNTLPGIAALENHAINKKDLSAN